MIPYNKYVPILKSKEGEFTALSKLDGKIKDDIIPIIDIVPNNNKNKIIDAHIESILKYFSKWGAARKIYIDGYMIRDMGNMSSGIHPLAYIFNKLREQSYNVIPVFSNITEADFNSEVKTIIQQDNKGACLRLFKGEEGNLNYNIDELLSFVDIAPNQVDLVIDLRSLERSYVDAEYEWTKNFLNNLKYSGEWRSIVVAGGNFPIDLSELKADQIHIIHRKMWEIWKRLYEQKQITILPAYADYAISHPFLSDIELMVPNASASIRYTHEDEYYIYRGRGTRQYGFEQFYDLSEALINSSEYEGREHCLGDEFIYKCGTEKKQKGNLTTWRWVGTAHHITVVVNQLRQFFRDFNI